MEMPRTSRPRRSSLHEQQPYRFKQKDVSQHERARISWQRHQRIGQFRLSRIGAIGARTYRCCPFLFLGRIAVVDRADGLDRPSVRGVRCCHVSGVMQTSAKCHGCAGFGTTERVHRVQAQKGESPGVTKPNDAPEGVSAVACDVGVDATTDPWGKRALGECIRRTAVARHGHAHR